MISFLKGKIIYKNENFIILDVRDIGYKIFVNSSFILELEKNKEAEIYIHQHIKEDALDLYGFRNIEELELFQLLLSISGIGPKSAIAVLAISSVADIKNSIACGDSALLIKVSGIGKKTAQRVVLELRDKVGSLSTSLKDNIEQKNGINSINISSDEIDALIALGYSLDQAREALRKVDASIKNSGERIKQALKSI